MFWKNDHWWEGKNYWDDDNISPNQLEWDNIHQYHFKMIPPPPTTQSKCLDIGTGSGLLTKHIEDNGYEVTGIECDEKAVEIARAKGLNVLKINAEEDKFPFPVHYFDVITCFEVIEHIKNPSNLLREVYRVLKDDGYFIISTPNVLWWYMRLKFLFGIWGTIHFDHVRFFTPKSLKECLNFYGFKVLKTRSLFLFPRIAFFPLPYFHSISCNFVFKCVKRIRLNK